MAAYKKSHIMTTLRDKILVKYLEGQLKKYDHLRENVIYPRIYLTKEFYPKSDISPHLDVLPGKTNHIWFKAFLRQEGPTIELDLLNKKLNLWQKVINHIFY